MTDRKRTPLGMAYHPSSEALAALVDGNVTGKPMTDLFRHLGICDECRAAYHSATAVGRAMQEGWRAVAQSDVVLHVYTNASIQSELWHWVVAESPEAAALMCGGGGEFREVPDGVPMTVTFPYHEPGGLPSETLTCGEWVQRYGRGYLAGALEC